MTTRPLNPVSYFEIPVNDLDSAIAFYEAVFGYSFERAQVDANEMAFFPYSDEQPGASGALAQGESYLPGKSGVRIYFEVDDVQETLRKAVLAGGEVLYPETAVGAFGVVAEIEDLDGNCIGLHAASPSRHSADEHGYPAPHQDDQMKSEIRNRSFTEGSESA